MKKTLTRCAEIDEARVHLIRERSGSDHTRTGYDIAASRRRPWRRRAHNEAVERPDDSQERAFSTCLVGAGESVRPGEGANASDEMRVRQMALDDEASQRLASFEVLRTLRRPWAASRTDDSPCVATVRDRVAVVASARDRVAAVGARERGLPGTSTRRGRVVCSPR
jgi:hypothetical protein